MRHQLIVNIALLVAVSPALAQGGTPDRALTARIDSMASREAGAGWFSGIVLVARGEHILLQRPYGFADWESRAPNSATTRFGVGSITKVLTEMVVDMLSAAGRLDQDAPVSRYLGSFPAGPNGGQVTIRHLLTHRSGVPWRVTTPIEETQPLHPSDIVERVRAKGLLFEPGSRELYSSAGFSCLARVVEIIEGRPFDVVLRDRIFHPASMTGATGETGQELMPARARPHRLGAVAETMAVLSAPYKDLSFLTGAGSLYATARDLLHFVRALRNGVFGREGQRQVADSAGIEWRPFYGRINGYEASVDYDPKHDLTFVLLSNLQSAATFQLRVQIKNVLLRRDLAPVRRPLPVTARFETPESFTGPYGDPDDPIIVELVDGHLLRDGNEFYPSSGDSYYVPATGAVMRFSRDSSGATDAMLTDWPTGQKTRAARVQRRP